MVDLDAEKGRPRDPPQPTYCITSILEAISKSPDSVIENAKLTCFQLFLITSCDKVLLRIILRESATFTAVVAAVSPLIKSSKL